MATQLAERIRHAFNVEDWYALSRTGVLAADYRGELLEGEIIDMPPIGSEDGGIVIARSRDDFYRRNHPTPADILLIIEVADRSLLYDRTIKGPLYARYGIPEYWLVNLPDRCLECYRSPTSTDYLDSSRHLPGETLHPRFAAQLGLPTLSLPVEAVFG